MKKILLVVLILLICAPLYGQSTSRIISSYWRDNGTAIVKGLIPDKTAIFLFGHNSNIAATYELVWRGDATYAYLQTGAVIDLVSTSANDDTSGTGARTVKVTGLDSSYAEQDVSLFRDFLGICGILSWTNVCTIEICSAI